LASIANLDWESFQEKSNIAIISVELGILRLFQLMKLTGITGRESISSRTIQLPSMSLKSRWNGTRWFLPLALAAATLSSFSVNHDYEWLSQQAAAASQLAPSLPFNLSLNPFLFIKSASSLTPTSSFSSTHAHYTTNTNSHDWALTMALALLITTLAVQTVFAQQNIPYCLVSLPLPFGPVLPS
jgi:hypothetical protein